MNVWGKVKNVTLGGMFIGAMMIASTTTMTGCLTDDKKDSVVTPVDKSIKLTGEKTADTVWNLQGKYHGAFDLSNGVSVASTGAAADKHLLDLSTLTNLDANGKVIFPKTWTSGNGTMFVKAAAGFDYANATDSSVIKAYKAGTAVAITPVLAKNDVIIANLKGTSTKYAVILITDVVVTDADNNDYIMFSYKQTP